MGGDGALEFDFNKPGNVEVHSDHDIQSCSMLETGIKFPDDTEFTIVNNLLVAIRLKADRIQIRVFDIISVISLISSLSLCVFSVKKGNPKLSHVWVRSVPPLILA